MKDWGVKERVRAEKRMGRRVHKCACACECVCVCGRKGVPSVLVPGVIITQSNTLLTDFSALTFHLFAISEEFSRGWWLWICLVSHLWYTLNLYLRVTKCSVKMRWFDFHLPLSPHSFEPSAQERSVVFPLCFITNIMQILKHQVCWLHCCSVLKPC